MAIARKRGKRGKKSHIMYEGSFLYMLNLSFPKEENKFEPLPFFNNKTSQAEEGG